MDAGRLVMGVAHGVQVVTGLYGARCSYVAIVNLQKYEETTKKLAKWSNEADRQLQKTRTTQGSGALVIFTSLSISSALLLGSDRLPKWLGLTLSPIMLVAFLAARRYIQGFWTPAKSRDGKDIATRIPLPNMGDYNQAVAATEELLQWMTYLGYSWLATTLLTSLTGYV